MNDESYRSLFDKYRDSSVIEKAVKHAYWTLPQLMADVFSSKGTPVPVERDFQEIGALLTNNLASKLARILFPVQYPFFHAEAGNQIVELAAANGYSRDQLESGLAQADLDATRALYANSGYAALTLALKHLIVTGNVLLWRDTDEHTLTAYSVQNYVTKRDGKGRLLDCVLREATVAAGLPPEVRAQINLSKVEDDLREVDLYTRIKREYREGRPGYSVTQQADTYPVGSPAWYPETMTPWMAVTWQLIPGEHYGRGMVEDYAGGFAKLSSLAEAATLYGVETMRVIHFCSSAAGVDVDDVAKAETGAWLGGDPSGIGAHEAGDSAKLQQVLGDLETTFARLARAFMYSGNVRNAERVTAYELQREAEEAENTLGGVYSGLAAALQVPLAHVTLAEVRSDLLAALAVDELKLDVVAGIPALGRTADVQNLMLAMQEIAAVVPLVQIDDRYDMKRIVDLITRSRSVPNDKLRFPPAEYAQIAAARKQAEQGLDQLTQAAATADGMAAIQQLGA